MQQSLAFSEGALVRRHQQAGPSAISNHAADPAVNGLDRRNLLSAAILLAGTLSAGPPAAAKQKPVAAGDWSSPGLGTPVDDSQPRFYKTPDGVKVQELAIGRGQAASNGQRVVVEYVLRRANGYFIYSTVEGVSFQPRDVPTEPFEFTLGQDDVIPGLSEVVSGMQPGGRRRALIPPSAGYRASEPDRAKAKLLPQPPTFATQRQLLNHCGEPLSFEVELVKIRTQ